MKGVLAIILVWFCAPTAFAQTEKDSLPAFIATYECRIVDALKQIDAHAMTEQDRYLIVASTRTPSSYVQCMLHDDDTAIYCEAASGFYFEPGRARALAGSKLLADLGFSTVNRDSNYSRDGPLSRPNGHQDVAHTILAALYGAYGVRRGDVTLTAPFAQNIEGALEPCPALTS